MRRGHVMTKNLLVDIGESQLWILVIDCDSFTFDSVIYFGAFMSVQTQKSLVKHYFEHRITCSRTEYLVHAE